MQNNITHNPVAMLKKDHRVVEELFAKYEELGEGAVATKRKVVDQIIHELTVHVEMEERFCYPRFLEALDKTEDKMVEEAYVEHAGAKILLTDLKTLQPDKPEFDASVNVLMEQIRHHVKEEEKELFPAVEKEMSKTDLEAMAEDIIAFKESQEVALD